MPFIIYSVLRIALIVVVGAALYLVGMRGWLLGVVAVLVALLVSYLALSRQREAAAVYIATRRTRRQTSGVRLTKDLDRDNTDEDEAVDARAQAPERSRPTVPLVADEAQVRSDREPDPEQ